MKKIIIAVVILLAIISLIFFAVIKKKNIKEKLVSLGYDKNEVKLIIKKVPSKNYEMLKKYDESIIDLISSKDYNQNNFSKYYKYYLKNKKSNIKDIITIINSGNDLMNYPASPLLTSLVQEKYYINKNVARYLDYGNKNKIKADEIISLVNSNADYKYYTHVQDSNISDNNLILTNKYYRLKEDYVPNDLVELTSKYNKGKNNKMRKEAAEAFMKMADAALLDNIIIQNASAYRSYEYQDSLYKTYESKEGKENADLYSARPGHSEHQTGLCTDINIIDSSFDNTPESIWLSKNAHKYGFILRFPKEKEKITGYKYESWHYRYVGEKIAKKIYEENITLDEYYEYYVKNK